MKIDDPSPELIAAAEAAGVYAFGHPTDPTPAEALKACPDPWCPTNEAGAPEFGAEPLCVYQEYGGHAVQCAVCELAGPHKRTADEAIAAWNTRPTPDAGEVRTYREGTQGHE